MKTNKLLSINLSLLLGLTVILGFDSCKTTNPFEGAKLIINYDLIKTNFNIQFVDATTGNLIGFNDNTNVKITVSGEDKDAVINSTGEIMDAYYSSNGFVGMALNPNVEYKPSPSSPIKFTLVFSIDGYLSTSKSFTITQEGDYFDKMIMTDLSNPPNGVLVKEEKNIGNLESGGLVKEDIGLETDNGIAKIIIPAGTVIKDANGDALVGSLDITLVYFSNLIDESLAAFPGGLMTRVSQDGQTSDGAFFSAGFLAIEIYDQNGTPAEFFEENKVGLSMGVEAATYNPETQAVVSAGNSVPLYSYNTSNGEWTYEQTAVLEANGRFGYVVNAEIDHLSYWNFDWFWSEYCYEGIEFIFTGDYAGCGCMEQVGIMRKQADNTFFSYVFLWACDGVAVQTYYAPANLPVYIEWIDGGCTSVVVDEQMTYIDNLCAMDVIEINLTAVAAERTLVTVEAIGYCPGNEEVEIRPSYGAYFRPVDAYCWRWANMVNGVAEICDVEMGKEYVIGTYFNGEWYETNYVVDQNAYYFWEIEFPSEVCNSIF